MRISSQSYQSRTRAYYDVTEKKKSTKFQTEREWSIKTTDTDGPSNNTEMLIMMYATENSVCLQHT